MRIRTDLRFRPYTHLSGEMCMLPGTLLAAQVYPSCVKIYDLSIGTPRLVATHTWGISGIVQGFTVEQDLEKGWIRVWGKAANGFFRYAISGSGVAYSIKIEKSPEGFGESFSQPLLHPIVPTERLSLGVNKKQDWSLVKRRHSLAEIIPFWLRLGAMTPKTTLTQEGTASLLNKESLSDLFLTGFEGLFYPQLSDFGLQGLELAPVLSDHSPAILLSEGARLIRSLFLDCSKDSLFVMPNAPQAFHSGRFINVSCEDLGEIDMEWRSRKLRRVVFRSAQSGSFKFFFPSKLKTCRLQRKGDAKKQIIQNGCPLEVLEGQVLFFDRFENS